MCALATPHFLLILYPLMIITICPRLVFPGSPPDPCPPPIAEAWPVEAQEVEAPMTTTTPPISPSRALRQSLSTVVHGCGGENCAGTREARIVPRLEGLPDHAMRAFLTECVACFCSAPQALLFFLLCVIMGWVSLCRFGLFSRLLSYCMYVYPADGSAILSCTLL